MLSTDPSLLIYDSSAVFESIAGVSTPPDKSLRDSPLIMVDLFWLGTEFPNMLVLLFILLLLLLLVFATILLVTTLPY